MLIFRYAEYVVVKDAADLVPIPDSMALDVAAMLPCGALTAYSAVQRAKEFVERKLQTATGELTPFTRLHFELIGVPYC